MAVSRPFVFGQFRLFEGREAYSLQGAEISNYFTELSQDVDQPVMAPIFWSLPIITAGKIWMQGSCFCFCISLFGRC